MFNTCLNLADKLGILEERKKSWEFLSETIDDPAKIIDAKINHVTKDIIEDCILPLEKILQPYIDEADEPAI